VRTTLGTEDIETILKALDREEFEWEEPLPRSCPPEDAREPAGDAYFRFVESIPPTDRDFWSQRKLFPGKLFNVDECTALACSLISNVNECVRLLKLPSQKNKKVVEFTPPADSGLIKNTRSWYHYSWWRVKGFDPAPYCTEVNL
jgi:hypothetical protein